MDERSRSKIASLFKRTSILKGFSWSSQISCSSNINHLRGIRFRCFHRLELTLWSWNVFLAHNQSKKCEPKQGWKEPSEHPFYCSREDHREANDGWSIKFRVREKQETLDMEPDEDGLVSGEAKDSNRTPPSHPASFWLVDYPCTPFRKEEYNHP